MFSNSPRSSGVIAQLATKAAEDGFDGFVLLAEDPTGELEVFFDEIRPELRGFARDG